jgi:hypothetical protein
MSAVDEGPPSSYLLLAKDTPVFAADGAVVGTVKEVLCEPSEDIFDGLVLAGGDGDRFVASELVVAVHERGVDVSFPAAGVRELPAPPSQRRIKYDVVADGRVWAEVLHWLSSHLAGVLHPGDRRLAGARERIARREKALALAREDPRLALEAGVGRPDLPGAYDGGLVDLNHAPESVIASLPGFDAELARRLVQTREQVEGFSSLEDVGAVLDLSGSQVERVRDRVVCLPG